MKTRKKLSTVFILTIFIVNFATNTLNALIGLLMYSLGLLGTVTPLVFAFFYILSVALIGALLAAVVSKRYFSQFTELSEAMKRVAGGDFEVAVNENRDTDEISDMARSFNMMTRELAGTEMMRNDFIANVSHELKTPLTAIEGYASLIRRGGDLNEQQADYLGRIIAASKRLSRLTGNILLLSKLENQEIEIKKESYRLDRQLREAVLTLEHHWSEKGLEPDIDLCEAEYRGNADLLSEVWQNLLSNAIKFSPEGGRLGVSLASGDGEIRVSVSDEGKGISPEEQKRIFEKFYQADFSRSGEGNGLGLALAEKIVSLHGGRIEIESEEGRGSTFTVRLPIE